MAFDVLYFTFDADERASDDTNLAPWLGKVVFIFEPDALVERVIAGLGIYEQPHFFLSNRDDFRLVTFVPFGLNHKPKREQILVRTLQLSHDLFLDTDENQVPEYGGVHIP